MCQNGIFIEQLMGMFLNDYFCDFFFLSQLVNPNNKDIRDIPRLAPPVMTRELL